MSVDTIDIDEFLSDIEPELAQCPVPVMEKRLRETAIDICEQVNLWTWRHPELNVYAGERHYTLTSPTTECEIFSILELRKEGVVLEDQSLLGSLQPRAGRGYIVPRRGEIELLHEPGRDAGPVAPQNEVIEVIDLLQTNYGLNDIGFYFTQGADFETGVARNLRFPDALNVPIESSASPGFHPEAQALSAPNSGFLKLVDENGDDFTFADSDYSAGTVLSVQLVEEFFGDDYLEIVERNPVVTAVASTPVKHIRGLEPLVTLKPTRDALRLPQLLLRDYYDLVVAGTLARARMMAGYPWSEPKMASQHKLDYFHLLAGAKRAADRGFTTKSTRVYPRRFAASRRR